MNKEIPKTEAQERIYTRKDYLTKKKVIGEYLVTLRYFKDAGGQICIWSKDKELMENSKRLPHIYPKSIDGEWVLEEEGSFMHSENALDVYRQIKTYDGISEFRRRVYNS